MPPGQPENRDEKPQVKRRIIPDQPTPRSPSPRLDSFRSPTPQFPSPNGHNPKRSPQGNASPASSRSFGSWGEAAGSSPEHNQRTAPPRAQIHRTGPPPTNQPVQGVFHGRNYCHLCKNNEHKTHQCHQWDQVRAHKRHHLATQNGLCHNCFRAGYKIVGSTAQNGQYGNPFGQYQIQFWAADFVLLNLVFFGNQVQYIEKLFQLNSKESSKFHFFSQ